MNKNLNRDDHQFHQYQQNEQSLLILTELTEYQKVHDIWRWRSRTWIRAGRHKHGTCGGV